MRNAMKQWKSSIRRVKSSGASREDTWRSRIRYIDPGYSPTQEWKPSVKLFKHHETESTKHEGRRHIIPPLHSEPSWRPHNAPVATQPRPKWTPPFRSLDPGVEEVKSLRKRAEYYFKEHPRLQLFSFEGACNTTPTASELPKDAVDLGERSLRKRVNEYFYRHPHLQLFSLDGKASSNVTLGDCSPDRQYIPDDRLHHLESDKVFLAKQTMLPSETMCNMSSSGERNLITGLKDQTYVKHPSRRATPAILLSPAGSYNEYVIDGRFSSQSPTKQIMVPSNMARAAEKILGFGLQEPTDVMLSSRRAAPATLLRPAGSYNEYIIDSKFSCQAQIDDNTYSSDQLMESLTYNSLARESHRRRQSSVNPALKEHL